MGCHVSSELKKYYESVFWGLKVWGISTYLDTGERWANAKLPQKKNVKDSYLEWHSLNR